MDLETRQQKQQLARLRADVETERAAREKAEANVLKISQELDVREAHPVRFGPFFDTSISALFC